MSDDERVAVVDKNDHVLEYKRRGDLTDDDCKRCAIIWIENSHGQVLLQQRSNTVKIDPGLWSPVVGTICDEGSYEETAVRELEEEIGLTGTRLTETNKLYYKAAFGWRQAQGFMTICDWPVEKFTVQPEEVAQVAWINKQQLLDELAGKIAATHPYVSTHVYWPKLFNL